ncbi:hypothetical protein HPB52_002428 [Rhipicephalus sanguineus]|uniref:SGNH hydrolase-type esterase domain-containing protein n=2 Tax=Rhipicephalus sanguineus TaxID=34632 RepID=A0A9D4SVG7_RHISA|nr:hypothetical protein HPB52_002428 [Rhipicephalus sanguineus]
MVKRTEKTTGASDLVQCGECTRWCYLDETAFTSLADAEEASFVCKVCEKVKAAVQRMESCIEELKGELKVERVKRIELQAQLGEARERGEATASLVEQMEADLRKERERRAELEERVKVLMALDSGPEQCEAKGKGITEFQAETGKKGDLGAAVAHVGIGDSRRKSYSDVARQASGGAKQGAPAAGSLSRVGDTQRTGDQRGRTGSQQSQAGSERLDRRRVLVVGDSNVARVKQGVLTTVKADRRVKVEAQSGKCMTDALAKAQEVVGDSMEGENLVIIHAGLNDVLKGKSQNLQRQLEDGVRKLREASEGVHVTICTIPEVWGQSGGMERRVIEANCVIRAMSRQLSYSVMEVNKDVYEPGLRPFAQDGIHYSGATGRRVGNRMGRQATAFLGGPSALRPPV